MIVHSGLHNGQNVICATALCTCVGVWQYCAPNGSAHPVLTQPGGVVTNFSTAEPQPRPVPSIKTVAGKGQFWLSRRVGVGLIFI